MRVLVIASYGGERRVVGCSPQGLLHEWEKILKQFPHNIDEVVVVSNIAEQESADYLKALDTFPGTVMRRENINGSYGAFKHVWNTYGDKYDWYYIFEDDYRPNLPNWDDIMLGYMTDKDAYVGARLSREGEGYPIHMSHCCGVMRSKAFESIKIDEMSRVAYDGGLQVDFTQDLIKDRWECKDVAGDYSIPYRGGVSNIRELGNGGKPILIIPVELGLE